MDKTPLEILDLILITPQIYRTVSILNKHFRNICLLLKKSKVQSFRFYYIEESFLTRTQGYKLPNGNYQTTCEIIQRGVLRQIKHYNGRATYDLVQEYREGILVYSCEYKGGRICGFEKKWNLRGQLLFFCSYSNSLKEDSSITYRTSKTQKCSHKKSKFCFHCETDGSVYLKLDYKLGRMEGMEVCYHKNGYVSYHINRVQGLRQGWYKAFFNSGVIKTRVYYIDDMKDGVEETYTYQGKIRRTKEYYKGKANGYETFYDYEGNIIKRAYWINDFPLP